MRVLLLVSADDRNDIHAACVVNDDAAAATVDLWRTADPAGLFGVRELLVETAADTAAFIASEAAAARDDDADPQPVTRHAVDDEGVVYAYQTTRDWGAQRQIVCRACGVELVAGSAPARLRLCSACKTAADGGGR